MLLVQFQEFLFVSKANRKDYICTSCQGKKHKCLRPGFGTPDGVEIESLLTDANNKRVFRNINASNIYEYIDEVWAAGIEADELTITFISHGSDVCPIALIDMETIVLKDMIDLCDRISPSEYMSLPAIYTEAMKIVKSEENRLIPMRPIDG